jgi:hypothetical protein
MTSSKFSDTWSQYKIFSSVLNYVIAVMIQQQTSYTVRQPQDHISDSLCRPTTVQQGGSSAQHVTVINGVDKQVSLCSPLLQKLFNDRLKRSKKSHLQIENLQHQCSQQG